MILIECHATPSDEHRSGEVGGAYVVCWIDTDDREEAVERAYTEIVEAGWIPDPKCTSREVAREDYDDDDPSLEYFEQALIDKEVSVFHIYPLDDADPPAHESAE